MFHACRTREGGVCRGREGGCPLERAHVNTSMMRVSLNAHQFSISFVISFPTHTRTLTHTPSLSLPLSLSHTHTVAHADDFIIGRSANCFGRKALLLRCPRKYAAIFNRACCVVPKSMLRFLGAQLAFSRIVRRPAGYRHVASYVAP